MLLLALLCGCSTPRIAELTMPQGMQAGTAFTLPSSSPLAEAALPQVAGLERIDFHGIPALRLRSAQASAVVSLFGGQVLSFVPNGGEDVLWLSPRTELPPKPIRGGVPVLWPYMARQGQTPDMPAHGFVRDREWMLQDARHEGDELVVSLAPASLGDTPLRLRMTLRLGRGLQQELHSENIGDTPVRFTQALHNYFRVGDAMQARIHGLDGARFLDKNENYATVHVQRGDWSLQAEGMQGRSDRLYAGDGHRHELRDPVLQRKIVLRSTGSRSVVVWNPGEQGAAKMPDIGPGWRDFICLETTNAGPDVIELAPGESHVLRQQITVEPL
ncbi:MAG: D-hexose-6-phosphate mutarotase [Pseudoxanthomonas sp.]